MKKFTGFLFLLTIFYQGTGIAQSATKGQGGSSGSSWTIKQPFQRDVFIENKGQFSQEERKAVGSKIVYYTHKGSLHLYFTPSGLIMRKDSVYKVEGNDETGDEHEDGMRNLRVMHQFTKMQWVGCNPSAKLEVENETPDYFTFPNHDDKTGKSGIMAHAWTKLTSKNIYNGIDIEFFYPEDKGGIEYNIVVHPGADPKLVKMTYSGSSLALNGNNLTINTGWDKITDHAPTAKDGNGNAVPVSFALNANMASFHIGSYDKTKTLVIDPWMTLTSLGGSNLAYDLGYDYLWNAYVYGGGVSNFYELQKYSSTGALLWTYIANNFTYLYVSGYFYGGMCTDHKTGTSYMCEGFNPGAGGDRVAQVNYAGIQTALLTTGNVDEMWRIGYDYCNDQLVIIEGGGQSANSYAAILDTNCTTLQNKNILNANIIWDQSLLGFDNNGQCYVGTSTMVFGNGYNNQLCKLPLPTLTPTTWQVSDLHNFIEITNISYYPPLSGYVVGNGFNGLVATPSFVITYDGGKMRQWNASTGVIRDSATVSGTSNAWGGVDIDCQGNVYCGNNKSVSIYDSNMNSIGSIPLNNTVYAVLVAPNGNIYASGNGYVQCVAGGPKLVTATYTPAGCACTGSATAHPCGTGPFTYLWSNGATTQTISNMCSGIYTVTVTTGTCIKLTDTAIVNLGAGGGFAATVTSVNPSCATSGSATANPTGGHPPYTYQWSNGSTTSSDTGLIAGNYYVLIWDSTGCKDSLTVTLTNSGAPTVKITPAIDTICQGSSDTLVASGAVTYTWLPATGLSCTTCPNPTASPTITTTYTVTGDSNGCKATAMATVTVLPPPVITIKAVPDTVCVGNPSQLTAKGGISYVWAPSTGLSCTNCANPIATPSVTTTYTVIVTDAHGCTNASSITVYTAAGPTLNVSKNKSICPGQTLTLNAIGTGTTYNWQPGNYSTPNITVSPTVTTTYTVTLADGCGIATAYVTVNVNPAPIPSISADVMAGCAPLCVQFRNRSTISSGGILGYTWNFGNGDTADIKTPVECYYKPGVYTVDMTITSDSGCSATLKVLDMITVYSHPNAAFTTSPNPATMLQPTIEFADQSSDAYGIAYWNWTFGDATDSVRYTQNASHTYADTGTYCARLIITNNKSCADTATNCLIIGPLYTLYIPDAFSPNGDGKNDEFRAYGNDVKTFEMYIFDRWGMQLFHSNDISNGWNGKLKTNGVICQEDTYVYLINVTDSKNEKHSYLGKVNLIK